MKRFSRNEIENIALRYSYYKNLYIKNFKVVYPICFTKHNNYNDYLPLEENELFPMMTEIDYDD